MTSHSRTPHLKLDLLLLVTLLALLYDVTRLRTDLKLDLLLLVTLLALLLESLGLALGARSPVRVVDGCVLEQRREDEDEAHHQVDVYSSVNNVRGVCVRHDAMT